MRGVIAPTDFDWYRNLLAIPELDEVNFWRPAGHHPMKSISPGEPFFFKLKAPHNAIGGFGFFVRSCAMPASYAWEAFREKNGVSSYSELLERCAHYRRNLRKPPLEPGEDPEIGCLLLVQCAFFEERDWIPQPSDWRPTTISPTAYDLTVGEGARIWMECLRRMADVASGAPEPPRYGTPHLVEPRLGQGSFRLSVADAYQRACAVTEEHSLPALEAAHIKPFAQGGVHSVRNGLLFRADVHKLFDAGYVTVTPDAIFRVSPRLRRDWKNGRSYYPLDGKRLTLPRATIEHPDAELLRWHNEHVFKSTGS